MTPEDLAAIRARDAEAPSVYVVPADTPAALIELVLHQASPAIADRRALLAEVDRLTERLRTITVADVNDIYYWSGTDAERARIRAAVEGLPWTHNHVPSELCLLGVCPARALAAVLTIVEGTDVRG